MTRSGIVLAVTLVLGARGVLAQAPGVTPITPPPESLRMAPPVPPGGMDPERARVLREQVEERFGRMVQTRLQLNEPQMERLRTAMRASQDRRRVLLRREADLRRGIMTQMQPGVAANADSLDRMLQAQSHIKVELAQSDEQFARDVTFLTPVQRAQLFMMIREFEQRVQEIARRRRENNMGPPPDRDRDPRRDGRAPNASRPF